MKIENTKLTITFEDPNELLEGMEDEEKLDFLQSLSCHDVVIDYVMQQVFQGMTEGGFEGSKVGSWDGNTPLQLFRKYMIEQGSDYATKQRISELERTLSFKDEMIQDILEENFNLRGY